MPGRCLMVKDPSGTLPHADAEEAALRECFGKDLTVIEGFAATRATVLAAASSHSILHFATHAVYRYDRPEFSHLELADGEKLLASDILGLNLGNARLVTLSACDSGRGDYSRAEELIGLPRAFLSAGACAVLATLWPVEDHPGIATIMKAFYQALQSSGPRTAASTAQRAARIARTPSTLWSSLVLMGS
jgi:CHAT domain-containing protein